MKCSLWQSIDGSFQDKVIFQKLCDGAVDIKWQRIVRQEFAPLFEEVFDGRPALKILAFKIARPCGSRFLGGAL